MKNKLLMTLILGILLTSIASATLLGTFKQNQNIPLIQTCSDCTYNKITYIQKPDGAILNFNVEMDKDGTFYNWTLDSNYTDQIGIYLINGIGDIGGTEDTWYYDFKVTPDGKEFTTQNSISYLGFILIILFTFFLTMYGAGRIEWKSKKNNEGKILTINNFKYVKILLYTLAYFELMFLFGLSYKVCREADIEGFAQFFNFIYQLFLNLIYPLIIGLIIIVFVIWINNRKLSKRLKLGLGK